MSAEVVIALAGAGGVGKTTLLKELKDRHPDWAVQNSTTREYFALRGIKSQHEALALPEEERRKFQEGCLWHYLRRLRELREACEYEVMVIDRSPFDHVGYLLDSCPSYTRQDFDLLRAKVGAGLASWLNTHALIQGVCFLRYPAPWVTDESVEDGFRFAPFSQSLKIDAIFDAVTRIMWHGPLRQVSAGWDDTPSNREDYGRKSVLQVEDLVATALRGRTSGDEGEDDA